MRLLVPPARARLRNSQRHDLCNDFEDLDCAAKKRKQPSRRWGRRRGLLGSLGEKRIDRGGWWPPVSSRVAPRGVDARAGRGGCGQSRLRLSIAKFRQRLRISLAISSASSPQGGERRILSPTKSYWNQESGNTNNAVESTEQNPPLLESNRSRQNHYVAVN